MAKKSLDIENMFQDALTSERQTSMQLKKIKTNSRELASYSLQGTGDRKGSSTIAVRQVNGKVLLEDCVRLDKGNKGFEEDIGLLKRFMYEDLGCVVAGDVRRLVNFDTPKGYVVSFEVDSDKAQKALKHYIDTASEVMGSYFRDYQQIFLAFSLARERVGK